MVSETKQDNIPQTTTAAETLWSSALLHLENELPRATFDTWIRDLIPISLKDNVLTLSAGNAYARDWVKERVSQTIGRVLTSISGVDITTSFVVYDDYDDHSDPLAIEPSEDEICQDIISYPYLTNPDQELDTIDDVVELTPEYLSSYDEIVRPDRVIVFPSYYLRWIPYLGVDLAWLPIGFRQIAFLRGLKFNPGDTFQASGREIARWSGMSLRTFRRRVNDPMLRWFIKPNETNSKDKWTIGDDDRPHQEPSSWNVVMSMPLTPDDRDSLHAWLSHHFHKATSPTRLLELAIHTPLEELLPTPEKIIPPEIADNSTSVQSVVLDFIKQHYPDVSSAIYDLADALAHHIIGHPIVITHYFVRKWLPVLGAGPGWLITLMRNLVSNQLGPTYEVDIMGGYDELADILGISSKRVSRWILGQRKQTESLNLFFEEILTFKQSDQNVGRRYRVYLQDPITPKDKSALGEGRFDTNNDQGQVRNNIHKVEGQVLFGTHNAKGEERYDTHNDQGQEHIDTHEVEGQVCSDTHVNVGEVRFDTENHGCQERTGTGNISGGGLKDSLREEIESLNNQENVLTSSSIKAGAKKSNRVGGWDMKQLLANAKVYPRLARQIVSADPATFISWLLYAASSRGVKIFEPVGHAADRLRESPTQGAGGAYDRLSKLGPMKLAELVHQELVFGDAGWGQNDWKDAMCDADPSRLQLISEIIGIGRDAFTLKSRLSDYYDYD